jgi:hypothetical protein
MKPLSDFLLSTYRTKQYTQTLAILDACADELKAGGTVDLNTEALQIVFELAAQTINIKAYNSGQVMVAPEDRAAVRQESELAEVAQLRNALAESLKLQSHYATLLNQHDGGARMTFRDNKEWLERLRAVHETVHDNYVSQPPMQPYKPLGNA